MPAKQRFKLVVMKAESKLFCDPEWVVSEDPWTLLPTELHTLVKNALDEAEAAVAKWEAENKRIIREGS